MKNYWVYLLLITISILSIYNTGYSSSGQATYYFPLIEYYHDNSLFKNDLHMDLLSNIPFYGWKLFAFLINSDNLELIMFLLFVLSRILLCFSIYFLALTLFNNKKVALLSSFFSLFIIWTFNIGNFVILSSEITPYYFSIPFSIFSIAYFIKGDYLKSFLLLSLVTYFHPLSTFYIGCMYLIYFIFNLREINKRIFFCGFASFLLVLPVFIKTLVIEKIGFNFDKWLQFTVLRLNHHLFPSFWDMRNWILFSILVIFFFVSLKYKPKERYNKKVLFFGLTVLLFFICTLISEFYPNKEVIELTLIRGVSFFRIIMIIYISNYIYNELKKIRLSMKIVPALFILILFLGYILGPGLFGSGFFKYVEYPPKTTTQWENISIKTKELTNKDDFVITPPFEDGFKFYSERNEFYNWYESSDIISFPENKYYNSDAVITRFEIVCGDLNGFFEEGIWKPLSHGQAKIKCNEYYNNLTEKNLILLKEKYGITHAIFKKPKGLNLNILYENQEFILYKI